MDCRQGDEIHLVHVVPKLQMGTCFGAPPVDFLPQQDPIAYDQLVKQAETFIQTRFLPSLHSLRVHPIVHIVKVCPAENVFITLHLVLATADAPGVAAKGHLRYLSAQSNIWTGCRLKQIMTRACAA